LFPVFGKKVIVVEYGTYGVLGLAYLGLALGSLPGLRMNRATIALVGSAFLIALGVVTLQEAWEAIDPKPSCFS
jgi:di/tricarboxylate transporter